MRPPRRLPPITSLPPHATDEFGLPRTSFLSEACESGEEREDQLRAVRRQAFKFYRAACGVLGEEETKKLFEGFWKRREGRRRGSTNPEKDRALLEEYNDRLALTRCAAERERLFREIGELARDRFPGVFGNSAPAIEKHLRRLVDSQERALTLIAAQSRRWSQSQPQPPVLLLIEETEEPDTN
jgi:hypothetical protein